MGLFDAFRYDGKRALVVGGATGMGAAVAELVQDAGAEVLVMDRAEVTVPGVEAISVDLSSQSSIDDALTKCGGPIHALFSCAGVADGTAGIERINFIGHRYIIDRLRAAGSLPRGAAIGMISSTAGLGWENSFVELQEFLDITDFEKAARWAQEHGHADYLWSKKAINYYVAHEACGLLKHGVRINAIMPGPTNTPLAQANRDQWLAFGSDYRDEVAIEAATPAEQAYPLVFLCSDGASGVTGITMITDAGYYSSGLTGSFEPAQEVVGFLRSL